LERKEPDGQWQKASKATGKEKSNFNYARKRLVDEGFVAKNGDRYKITASAKNLSATMRTAQEPLGRTGRNRSKLDQPLAA
jgi:DNA-binding IclR family transcriptional regulator